MAVQLDLPLLELIVENFSCAWTQFKLVAVAKHWDEAKQVTMHSADPVKKGKFLDYYVELDTDQKGG